MVNYKAGQELFYCEGEDLVLGVEFLGNKSNNTTEAYRLKIQRIIRNGRSRFTDNIKLGETFICARERISVLSGLWELTESAPSPRRKII